MPKHIESRQSRLGADQPGGFCVRFFFSESRGAGGRKPNSAGCASCASCVVKKPRKVLQIQDHDRHRQNISLLSWR